MGMALMFLSLTSCGQASDSEIGETATNASGVAFSYAYDFRMPSDHIADAQERHARACEAMARQCRITGMTYRLDGTGQVSASLGVRVAAPIARSFGRSGVRTIEQAGGALTGAEIIGTDAQPELDAGARAVTRGSADLAEVDRRLARADLSADARTALLDRRAALIASDRERAVATQSAQASIQTTPIAFSYHAGSGVGLSARLSEAAQAGWLSLTWTLAGALTLLAYLAPPLALLLLVLLFWRRVARPWWGRLFPVSSGE
jgi:hypothetical protein